MAAAAAMGSSGSSPCGAANVLVLRDDFMRMYTESHQRALQQKAQKNVSVMKSSVASKNDKSMITPETTTSLEFTDEADDVVEISAQTTIEAEELETRLEQILEEMCGCSQVVEKDSTEDYGNSEEDVDIEKLETELMQVLDCLVVQK